MKPHFRRPKFESLPASWLSDMRALHKPPLCRCGHTRDEHHDGGKGQCVYAGEHAECACAHFHIVSVERK